MREFRQIGWCGLRVFDKLGKLVGYCTKPPAHRGGCTHVLYDARQDPQGHVIHYMRDR